MSNSFKKLFSKVLMIMALLFALQTSVWAQGSNDQTNASLSPSMVILFFALLLIALIAPAFKTSHKSNKKFSSLN